MFSHRVLAFLATVCAFAATYQIGSAYPVDAEEAALVMSELEELLEGIDGFGIFAHNTTIALPMFIPGFGAGWGLFSAWSTGYAFSAITTAMPAVSDIPPLSLLFLTPFGIMELAAYSLGISRSYILIQTIVRKRSLAAHSRATLAEIGTVLGLLAAGGYLEYYMIKLAEEGGMNVLI